MGMDLQYIVFMDRRNLNYYLLLPRLMKNERAKSLTPVKIGRLSCREVPQLVSHL